MCSGSTTTSYSNATIALGFSTVDTPVSYQLTTERQGYDNLAETQNKRIFMYLGIFLGGIPAVCCICCATKACLSSRLEKRRKVQEAQENQRIAKLDKDIQYITAEKNPTETIKLFEVDMKRLTLPVASSENPEKLGLDPNMKITTSLVLNTGVTKGKYDHEDFKEKQPPYAVEIATSSNDTAYYKMKKSNKAKKNVVAVDFTGGTDSKSEKDHKYYMKY